MLITHDPAVARRADRICVMKDGRLYEGERYLDPATLDAAHLEGAA